jgi:hypothetical protein
MSAIKLNLQCNKLLSTVICRRIEREKELHADDDVIQVDVVCTIDNTASDLSQ